MDSMITHFLDVMGHARYVVRWRWKDGFYDHSHARYDGTSTIRETAVKGWIR